MIELGVDLTKVERAPRLHAVRWQCFYEGDASTSMYGSGIKLAKLAGEGICVARTE